MNLLGTARALDDQAFIWKVKAACLTYAADNVGTLAGNSRNLALSVLMHPHNVDPSMLGFVAVDEAVSAAVTVSGGGSEVDTSTVADADILRVVADKWDEVAVKYPNSPLPGAAA